MAEVVADVTIFFCMKWKDVLALLQNKPVFVHVCVMRVDVGTDEINCPTVEARWWVHGGGHYTILSIFKKYVWNISSQKDLWRLTPAFSTLSFPSPHPEGVCHNDITLVAVISHVRPLHTVPSVQGSFPPFLTVHHSSLCDLTASHTHLNYSTIIWYCKCLLFCFLCRSVSFSGHFSASLVHSQGM